MGRLRYKNGDEAEIDFIDYVVEEDFTVYAKWKPKTYKVTFNYNYGDNPKTEERETNEDGKVFPPEMENEREDATFIGWYKVSVP